MNHRDHPSLVFLYTFTANLKEAKFSHERQRPRVGFVNLSPDRMKVKRAECPLQHQPTGYGSNSFSPYLAVAKSDPEFSNTISNVLPPGVADDLPVHFNHSERLSLSSSLSPPFTHLLSRQFRCPAIQQTEGLITAPAHGRLLVAGPPFA